MGHEYKLSFLQCIPENQNVHCMETEYTFLFMNVLYCMIIWIMWDDLPDTKHSFHTKNESTYNLC